MDEQFDIHSLAPKEIVYDVIYAWVRFPSRILIFVQSTGELPHGISCGECLSDCLRLLDRLNSAYRDDCEVMLIKQIRGENAKTKLFPKDPAKNDEDVSHAIISFL